MYAYRDILNKSISRGGAHRYYDKTVKNYEFNKCLYTGEDQDDILLDYRKGETDVQKDQRRRITKTLTKHICRQIENIYDELRILDKASINVTYSGNEDAEKRLKKWIKSNNIEDICFELVKYYNLIDASAFAVIGLNEYDDIEVTPIKSEMVYDSYIVNNKLKILIIQINRKVEDETVTDYRLYADDKIIDYKNAKGTTLEEGQEREMINDELYIVTEMETNLNYAFRLGWKKSALTNFKTCDSILDSASKLFVKLIWEGSELDIIKALHGIVKTFAYAQPCNHMVTKENEVFRCDGTGYLQSGQNLLGQCKSCNGSGLKIHKSSQDIVYLPEPIDAQNHIKLSDLTHTEFIPDSILQMRQQAVEDLETKIIKTIFNSNYTTKQDVQVTATEKMIDLKGIYSALGNLGKQVSAMFEWAVKCAADIMEMNLDALTVIHGYALNLKLEDLDTLITQRQHAVLAGVPTEVIKVIDFAILKKQHIDDPEYLTKFAEWDKFRPFSDKTENERTTIISILSDTDYNKVLYLNFVQIKQDILSTVKDWYNLTYDKQKAEIDTRVEAIIEEIKANKSTSTERVRFDALEV